MSGPSNHPNAAYPTWLTPSKVPLTVVVGPPGNGARSWVDERAAEDDLIVDLSAIIADLAGVARSTQAGPGWLIPAIGRRNELLATLGTAPTVAAAYFITGAPAAWQREFWSTKLGGKVVLLDPGKEAALIGARDEGVPERFVHQWYAEAAASAPPAAMPATAERETSAKRGYGNEHRVMRDRQLAREPWCRFCWTERQVRVPATVLDHIVPFRDAEGNFSGRNYGNPANHRSLCGPCHDARGATRSRAEKAPGAGVDGRPLDPRHPWSRKA